MALNSKPCRDRSGLTCGACVSGISPGLKSFCKAAASESDSLGIFPPADGSTRDLRPWQDLEDSYWLIIFRICWNRADSCQGLQGSQKEQILCVQYFPKCPGCKLTSPGRDLAGRGPHCLCVHPLTPDDCFWLCSVGDVVRARFLTIPSLQNSGGVMWPLIEQVVFRSVFIV